ncbi:MAG: helix-turn-helix domain-containing protein [Methanosarcina sp.]|nr:helix-turn-helix domain-containing protein [Methanosarcina sp.]MDD3316077.1 helix-turn-helix domain-containing protein [Methanosarcina sp.]MDD4305143.1 helix-turn-helix domain-containing protein [Methanosarcina sp.]NLN43515.1 helix-turn-helix transcriptional regulator [Methanosarcina sp.]
MKDCTVYKTMNIIGKRWTIHILLELHKGEKKEKRFNELKRKLGNITPKILSERLMELEVEGLITKKVDDSTKPPRSEYCLTESGMDFVKIIQAIKRWGLKWKFQDEECKRAICMYCDH